MEKYITHKTLLSAIKAFNISHSKEEFYIKLDLLGISIDDFNVNYRLKYIKVLPELYEVLFNEKYISGFDSIKLGKIYKWNVYLPDSIKLNDEKTELEIACEKHHAGGTIIKDLEKVGINPIIELCSDLIYELKQRLDKQYGAL